MVFLIIDRIQAIEKAIEELSPGLLEKVTKEIEAKKQEEALKEK